METTKLTHYSNTAGIEILLPQAGSTSPAGNGAEKKRAGLPGFVPRWYGYVDGQTPEYRIAGRKFKYVAKVSTDLLYDIEADSDDYRGDRCWGDPNVLEAALKEAGYYGYFSSAHGIAAIFGPLLCTQVTHERELFELREEV